MPSKNCYCICQNGEEENCVVRKMKKTDPYKFSELSKFEDIFEGFYREATKKGEDNGKYEWTWKCDNTNTLYYVFLYDDKGARVREHETIIFDTSSSVICHKFPKLCKSTDKFQDAEINKVMVLSLYKKNEIDNNQHVFVETCEAMGLLEYDLVIDHLSMVKQEDRDPEKPVYFGFLCAQKPKFSETKRVALKNETKKTPGENKKEILTAIEAGGQHNMKYLACTTIDSDLWIAMELCRMETLNKLIKMKGNEDQKYAIDRKNMKTCFRHVLLGLHHLHSKGFMHRNMIMENMLLSLDCKNIIIGDYDDVQTNDEKANDKHDLKMTANMFFKCLQREGETTKDLKDIIPNNLLDQILSSTASIELTDDEEKILQQDNIDINKKSIIDWKEDCDGIFRKACWVAVLKSIQSELEKSDENKEKAESKTPPEDLSKQQTKADNAEEEKFGNDKEEDKSKAKNKQREEKEKPMKNMNEGDGNDESPNSHLAAYLILFMASDKPEPREVLNHPFFWDEHKMLWFFTRASALFQAGENESLDPLVERIKLDVVRFCKHFGIDCEWYQKMEERLIAKDKLKNDSQKKTLDSAKDVQKKYGFSITAFFQLISNVYDHYHDRPVKKRYFETASEVWKFFNDMYPALICALHRAIWNHRESAELPDDIRRFYTKRDYTLAPLKLDSPTTGTQSDS